MGVDMLQSTGILLIKATTKETFSLIKLSPLPPPPPPQGRNRVNHAESSQSGMSCKKLNTKLVYFQLTQKNYIQDIVFLATCLQWCVIIWVSCYKMLPRLSYPVIFGIFSMQKGTAKAAACMFLNVDLQLIELDIFCFVSFHS